MCINTDIKSTGLALEIGSGSRLDAKRGFAKLGVPSFFRVLGRDVLEICRARSGFCRDIRGLKFTSNGRHALFRILMLELMVVHIAPYGKGLPSMETNYSMFGVMLHPVLPRRN